MRAAPFVTRLKGTVQNAAVLTSCKATETNDKVFWYQLPRSRMTLSCSRNSHAKDVYIDSHSQESLLLLKYYI